MHSCDGRGHFPGYGQSPINLAASCAAAPTSAFKVHSNYVALPLSEAFRIEYWALEEAKIRRQPAEKELSRQSCTGGWRRKRNLDGKSRCWPRSAEPMLSSRTVTLPVRKKVADESKAIAGKKLPMQSQSTSASAMRYGKRSAKLIALYGGLDILINTAALFPSSPDGQISDRQWA